MANIKAGPIVTAISGTIGGVTFSQNKGGAYAKSWSRSSNPRTTFQTDQRSSLAMIPEAWRGLTAGEVSAWNVWAALPAQEVPDKFGDLHSISGFAWFAKVNIRLLNIGRAIRIPIPTQLHLVKERNFSYLNV